MAATGADVGDEVGVAVGEGVGEEVGSVVGAGVGLGQVLRERNERVVVRARVEVLYPKCRCYSHLHLDSKHLAQLIF